MFEKITDDDVPGLVELINRAYRGVRAGQGWKTEASYISGTRTTVEMVHADIRDKPQGSFLKWADAPGGDMLGCIWVVPLEGGTWYFGTLAIDPERQNGGLGRTILQAAEQWVGERGATRVRMTVVNVRETLTAWYVRHGYRLTGETEPFPYDDDRFGTPLRDDLGFVVLEKDLTAAAGAPAP